MELNQASKAGFDVRISLEALVLKVCMDLRLVRNVSMLQRKCMCFCRNLNMKLNAFVIG